VSAGDLDALAAQLTEMASTLRRMRDAAAAPDRDPAPAPAPAPAPGNAAPSQDAAALARARRVERLRAMRRACFAEVAAIAGEPGFDILLRVHIGDLAGDPVGAADAATIGGMTRAVGARWITAVEQGGLVRRFPGGDGDGGDDDGEGRLSLTPRATTMMARYLGALPL